MKTPCKTCPWKRNALPPGLIGGNTPDVFIGQIQGPFYLPCHNSKGYAGKNTILESSDTKQCAGAAIFRSNIGVSQMMPKGIKILPEDKENVFASKEEFLGYYYNVSLEIIKGIFTEKLYRWLLVKELNDKQVKKVDLRKI